MKGKLASITVGLILLTTPTFGQVARKNPRAIENPRTSDSNAIRVVKPATPSYVTIYIIRLLIGLIR